MLNLYGSFNTPEVPNVKIYRDDENPHKFYMVPERATIARDDEGKPLFTFMLYARDVDKLPPDELEVERGYLAVTAQAAVPKEAEDKIRAYLGKKLEQEKGAGLTFLGRPIVSVEPELGYPDLWLDGSVRFQALGPDMIPYQAGSAKPSLIGSNTASFSAILNQDGAELFRQAVEKGIIPAGIWYELSFGARIPAITITIDGDRGEFYKEVKNYIRHRWEYVRRYRILGVTYQEIRYAYEWDELTSITKFNESFHALTINVDDTSLPDADTEMKNKLRDMAFEIFQQNVLPSFFEPAMQEVAKEEDNDPSREIPVNTVTTGRIDIKITQSMIVKHHVNPNAMFSQALTPEEAKALIVYVDLSQPYFQELDVSVHANVNFKDDPVYALKVFLDYDQQDDLRGTRVKKAEEFLFKSADQVGRFRTIMAKGDDGAPKDGYQYWSEISYKDSGETIRVPKTGSIRAVDRQLVISYRRLGFVRVNLVLGTMPQSVDVVQVKMRYPGYSGPSANQSFELSREKPTASFFTYTGKAEEPQPYRYQITYLLADGQRMDFPEETGQAETLTIRDPFEQTVTTRFLANGDYSVVEKIILDASYSDPRHDYYADHHAELVKNGETSAWSLGLRDPNKRDFEYTVKIINKDGSRTEQGRKLGRLGDTIAVGGGGVDVLDITVVGAAADWDKYKLIIVYLKYEDPANGVYEEKNFAFRSADDPDRSWKVLLRDAKAKSYSFKFRFVGISSEDSHETPWTPTEDPVVIIE